MLNAAEITKMDNQFFDFADLYGKDKRAVILYGAGSGSDWTIRLFKQWNIKIDKIVDRNSLKEKEGIPVIDKEKFFCDYSGQKVYIVITSPRFEQEIRALLEDNWSSDSIYCFECELYYSYIHDLAGYRLYLEEKQHELEQLYDSLADDFSRKTFKNVLQGRVSGRISYFQEVCRENQYFPQELFSFHQEEVLLDVGAYTGDTVEKVVQISGGRYKKVYCFEPDKECFMRLQENVKNWSYDGVQLISKGAWNQKEKIQFNEDSEHGASKISEAGGVFIELDCLDSMVSAQDTVTHIKMDIEGAELKALEGASGIIKRDKPFLGICVYHKNEDFLEISKYILSLVPQYQLYLRHHNISGTETVLYAKYDGEQK